MTHNISHLRLVNLHMSTVDDVLIQNYENVKAIMNISYGQKDNEQILYYHISVEENKKRLYSLKCEYHYHCYDIDDEKEMVMTAVKISSLQIEEIISMITLQINPKTN